MWLMFSQEGSSVSFDKFSWTHELN